MKTKLSLLYASALVLVGAATALAQVSFSVNSTSKLLTPGDDIWNDPIPNAIIPGAGLNVDAFSYGRSLSSAASLELPGSSVQVVFSVDPTTGGPGGAGMPGTAVNIESLLPSGNDAPADIFAAQPGLGGLTNMQLYDGDGSSGALPMGLAEPFTLNFDDADGLDFRSSPGAMSLIYFSLDAATAPNIGATGEDVYVGSAIAPSNYDGPTAVLFASGAQLGLNPGDELDALVVFDGLVTGQFDPGTDVILFSVATAGTYDPSTVYLSTGTGFAFPLWSANSLGLVGGLTDNLNALDVVPEQAALPFFLAAIGLLAAVSRRKR